ncbi:hypothetical protein C8T65DRAFT_589286, partial [Cerioporus squamosus]
RDADLWFPDGNIVVIAENTSFRVHKGVLARHSIVFHNMFDVPQPTDPDPAAADLIEGCPVVRVSDPAHDFKHLLHMLYDGFSYLKRNGSPTRLTVLLALVRLGKKYEFDDIVDAVDDHLDSLKTIFPSSFDDNGLDSIDANYKLMYKAWPEDQIGIGHPIEAINLFRLLSPRRDHMLPIAIYLCSIEGPSAVLLPGQAEHPTSERLSLEDAAIVLETHAEALRSVTAMLVKVFVLEVDKGCTGVGGSQKGPHCADALKDALQTSIEFMMKFRYCDLFSGFRFKMIEGMVRGGRLCLKCGDMLKERDLESRRDLWRRLPQITKVDVPRWEA